MFRKALFAVVLVSASFAGGAVVNGPGLQWAKALVLNRLGADGESVEDGNPVGPGAPAPSSEEIPARPIPPLVFESAPAADKAATKADTNRPAGTTARREPPPAAAADTSLASAPDLPVLAPVPERPAQVDPLPPSSPAPSPDREALSAAAERATKAGEPAVKRVSLANPADSAPAPAPADAPAGWAEVRASMRSLGVSRYGVEGEPGGRARFYCVIPVAGRRAVGQHFEAEGDDDLQAARAALKRVALWKATEPGGNGP